jgi:hypothetical protein
MKYRLVLLASVLLFACTAHAQFFKPLPKPGHVVEGRFGLATDSVSNSFRPVVSVTALLGDGSQLAGGFGIGYQHNKWDAPSQTWNTVWSLSAIGFLGTTGNRITGTIGGVFGFLNFISVGAGYDITQKKAVIITGAQLHFN